MSTTDGTRSESDAASESTSRPGAVDAAGPGRSCPIAYRYTPDDLGREPSVGAYDSVLVMGGVYGNPLALHEGHRMVRDEPGEALLVVNGDAHYLDAEPDAFGRVADALQGTLHTQGNVEYALATSGADVGCGCDYPAYVADDIVEASNAVVGRLLGAAAAHPEHRRHLGDLPRFARLQVGDARVGIVHGDLHSLAGWRLALEALEPPDEAARAATGWNDRPGEVTDPAELRQWMDAAQIDVLCCTHTGLAYLQRDGERVVVNNGTAGLPALAGTRHGVATRVATGPAPADSLYGVQVAGVRVDAVPVRYDHDGWVALFTDLWPAGTAGDAYRKRLLHGPSHRWESAVRCLGAR